MPINLSSEKGIIKKSLSEKYKSLIQLPQVLEYLNNNICDWFKEVDNLIQQENPFPRFRQQWKIWNSEFHKNKFFLNEKAIQEYKFFCRSVGIPFDSTFWRRKLENNEEKEIVANLLLKEWQKNLDKSQAQWELAQIELARKKFLSELEKWLELIQQLEQQLSPLGLDFGIWFDDSLGSLTTQSIKELSRWANYFAQDKEAQKIADLLGKMRQIEQSSKIELVTQTIGITVPVVDVNSKEEIIGLKLGKELEYVIPSELALMADSDTAILFDLKYLESKLVCFELQGTAFQDEQIEITTEIETEEDEKLGPMILCIDTSGSMAGTPENIAKAMSLYLGNKAKAENRKCVVINFSTGIETFEISATKGIADLVSFLSKSFYGGTDAAPALRHALSLCQSEKYEKADVLMISDFVMGTLPETLLRDIKSQREKGNQFHSLVIGNLFMEHRLKTHFDNEWVYNPSSHQIEQLVKFQQNISPH
ncbi:VWA domain-containing protein [Pasteurella multocida]|uniref:VWA domain-containing protein n=1 Tax=Pasteurella multocida TaxID=747 RepID=UPI0012398541|nr:VWA domain-containing protein [Pasteurella multocida]QEU00991.1 VWA domain-containing protein [Pasteurella multocida]HEA3274922.1 VWA domain-containing protein [Pasteurella multocida]